MIDPRVHSGGPLGRGADDHCLHLPVCSVCALLLCECLLTWCGVCRRGHWAAWPVVPQRPPLPGMTSAYSARVCFDYVAVEASELSVRAGEHVRVEQTNESGWCLARDDKGQGRPTTHAGSGTAERRAHEGRGR